MKEERDRWSPNRYSSLLPMSRELTAVIKSLSKKARTLNTRTFSVSLLSETEPTPAAQLLPLSPQRIPTCSTTRITPLRSR